MRCICVFACGCFVDVRVCVEERERKGENQAFGVEDGQALMDGGALGGAKCDLTAEFNDIYFQATRFQTCSGSVLSAGTPSSAQRPESGASLPASP